MLIFKKKIKCDIYYCKRKGIKHSYFSGDADEYVENNLCRKHRKVGE